MERHFEKRVSKRYCWKGCETAVDQTEKGILLNIFHFVSYLSEEHKYHSFFIQGKRNRSLSPIKAPSPSPPNHLKRGRSNSSYANMLEEGMSQYSWNKINFNWYFIFLTEYPVEKNSKCQLKTEFEEGEGSNHISFKKNPEKFIYLVDWRPTWQPYENVKDCVAFGHFSASQNDI